MLEISDIDTFRASAKVLHGVTLAVRADEVVCLVGRNGAGKTTTIESIMGLLPVRSGTIRFHETEITKLPPHERARRGMGYAPEDSGIFPDLTVGVNMIKSMGISILIAESNLATAAAVADRLYAIDRGEIIFDGKPDEALRNDE